MKKVQIGVTGPDGYVNERKVHLGYELGVDVICKTGTGGPASEIERAGLIVAVVALLAAAVANGVVKP